MFTDSPKGPDIVKAWHAVSPSLSESVVPGGELDLRG